MKDALIKYLNNNTKLSNNEIEIVTKYFNERTLDKKQFFVKSGEVCSQIAFVVDGAMRLFNEIDCEQTTFQFFLKDSFATSLTSLAFQTPSNWSIQAITDCKIMTISREDHFMLIEKYKAWLEVDNLELLKAYTGLESQMFSQLHFSAEERFNRLFASQPDIFNQIPLKYIASFLGMTPETLSRLRKKHVTV